MIVSLLLTGILGTAPLYDAEQDRTFGESRAIADVPVVNLNPSKAYILVRSDAETSIYLTRVPNAADTARYQALFDAALAKETERYRRRIAARDPLQAGQHSSGTNQFTTEPSVQNFAFAPFEKLAGTQIGNFNRFHKSKETSVYLQEITPGRYRIYGQLSLAINGSGAIGLCYCMGSVVFDAPAGVVTDLGRFGGQRGPLQRPKGDASWPWLHAMLDFTPPGPEAGEVDHRLAAFTVQPAVFRAAGKVPNFLAWR